VPYFIIEDIKTALLDALRKNKVAGIKFPRTYSLSPDLTSIITREATFGEPESLDYFADWRELKLEREVWRTLDMLSTARQSLTFRKKYYADLFEPASITSKVST